MNNYTPSQKARIEFIAYHHYLTRKREGLLGETDEERQWMADEDYMEAEKDFEEEERKKMRGKR